MRIVFLNAHAQTDEQAPLPDALQQLLFRIRLALDVAGDFIFNCQMGRGRKLPHRIAFQCANVHVGTTTGMVTACLIATTDKWDKTPEDAPSPEETEAVEVYDSMDGYSEEEAYLQGLCQDTLVWALTYLLLK